MNCVLWGVQNYKFKLWLYGCGKRNIFELDLLYRFNSRYGQRMRSLHQKLG